MRTSFARAAAVAALSASLIFAAATAAVAGTWTQAGLYGWPDQCSYYGQAGVTNHQWTQWYCETVTPANMALGHPGTYRLWVQ
ncbi:MAG: hypothetical protein HOV78_15070 [Hamadaea sp.]|nr:hypothetical protein [Hamadaea sp.]